MTCVSNNWITLSEISAYVTFDVLLTHYPETKIVYQIMKSSSNTQNETLPKSNVRLMALQVKQCFGLCELYSVV